MSLEKDITAIKTLMEAKPVFKAATPAQVAARAPKPTRMHKYSIPVYSYDALSEDAKEKAREWWLSGYDNSIDWETIQEDAKQIGLELHGTDHDYMKGEFLNSAFDCAKAIINNHGKKTDTYKTASLYLKNLKDAGKDEDKLYELDNEFLSSLCEDYRVMLRKEEEYQMSDEAAEEAIRANDYEFTADGKLFSAPHGGTVLEKLMEAKPIFKAASPAQVAKRYTPGQKSCVSPKTEFENIQELETEVQDGKYHADYIKVGGVDYTMVEYGMEGCSYGGSRHITYADEDTLNKEINIDMEDGIVSEDDACVDWTYKGYMPRKK